MDKLDTKIMLRLMGNSRMPLTTLAKQLRASREVLTYRISKLKKEKVIIDFVTEIDIGKLGYVGAAVFVKLKANKAKEFKDFLNKCGFVSWVAELSGVWNFGLSVYGRSNEELDEKFQVIYNKFKEDIVDHRFTLHRNSRFFYEKYFSSIPEAERVKKISISHRIDKTDKTILRELAKNSRIDCVELSKRVSITAPAVSKRIRQLERCGYIKKYSIFVDLSKLGLFQYSVFIINKNINAKKQLLSHLSQHPNISFIAEYVGDPFLEFGAIVKDPYDLRLILQQIEESFPDNRIMEVSLFQKEFVSVGPPSCVFE